MTVREDFLEGTQTLADMLAVDDLEARRAAVEQIKPIHDWRKTESAVKAELTKLDPSASDYGKMGDLRRWLLDHGEPLYDEEAGLKAWLQSSGESDAYDLPSAIKERAPLLYRRLEELGAFVVDGKRVDDLVNKGLLMRADMDGFTHKIGKTPSLRIAEEKGK